jgi:hypothetical protein
MKKCNRLIKLDYSLGTPDGMEKLEPKEKQNPQSRRLDNEMILNFKVY